MFIDNSETWQTQSNLNFVRPSKRLSDHNFPALRFTGSQQGEWLLLVKVQQTKASCYEEIVSVIMDLFKSRQEVLREETKDFPKKLSKAPFNSKKKYILHISIISVTILV